MASAWNSHLRTFMKYVIQTSFLSWFCPSSIGVTMWEVIAWVWTLAGVAGALRGRGNHICMQTIRFKWPSKYKMVARDHSQFLRLHHHQNKIRYSPSHSTPAPSLAQEGYAIQWWSNEASNDLRRPHTQLGIHVKLFPLAHAFPPCPDWLLLKNTLCKN